MGLFGRETFSVGAAIDRPLVIICTNHGMVVGAEDKNNPPVQGIALSQTAFCGRAQCVLALFQMQVCHCGDIELFNED